LTAPLSEDEGMRLQGIVAELLEAKKPPPYDSLPQLLRSQVEARVSESLLAFGDLFAAELARAAGAELTELRRGQKRRTSATVLIANQQVPWSLRLSVSGSGPEISVDPPDVAVAWKEIDHRSWGRLGRLLLPVRLSASALLWELAREVTKVCFKEFPPHARYLPAARSGLMQSYKVLAGSIVRRSSWAGIEDIRVPALTGVITDFLSEMIELDPTSLGYFSGTADALEADLLEGTLHLAGGAAPYPEVVYHSDQGEFPLGRTSSMISELAPVVLYLRHILRQNDLLIIEEPEAHLHPAAQARLAMHLVRVVNAGLGLTLTTHSEFFLQQLNNALIASGVGPESSENAGLSPADTIKPDKVAAYLFKPSARGTEVENPTIDPAQGVPEDSFGEVAERLYDQNVKLDPKVALNG
jgi:hypothetical protein